MARMDVTTRLIELAARHFGRKATDLSADDDFFRALEIDSMQSLELLTALENEFSVEVPDYELQGVTTFSALAKVIERRL